MLQTDTKARIDGVVIGVVAGFSSNGEVLVAFGDNPQDLPIAAKAATAVSAEDLGRQAAILFENGNVKRPVVMGLINNLADNQKQVQSTSEAAEHSSEAENDNEVKEAVVDGERVVLQAKESIELKCGKASITLTKAGKIIVRGAYLSSKSSGVNRIHGGSVQIN